ncbi:MAG TPA: methionyl-tRNA formyltransferase [Candidatus Saccharimonadales bacterium]|nr:methionyl-tRNA formyltransferase [Candidatus Saccharimonadales bacterium]
MKQMSEPIVFFGSGPVAAESLRLLAQKFPIEAVVTKPRPPHHRGDVPVLALAEKLGLTTHTISSKAELDELFAHSPVKARLGILIDFGIIVSQMVINYFPLGIINSHFSILPEWRGADPITFAILSGQKQTGVSLMFLVAAMDEGPLLAYGEYNIPEGCTTPELTDGLITLSDALLAHEIPRYLETADETGPHGAPQTITGREVSYSRKLTKEDGILDWHKSAAALEREIRAFSGWPKSRATLGKIDGVITQAHVIDEGGTPGTLATINGQLVVRCGEQSLAIDRLKPAGKQEMTGQAFLAGYTKQLPL